MIEIQKEYEYVGEACDCCRGYYYSKFIIKINGDVVYEGSDIEQAFTVMGDFKDTVVYKQDKEPDND